MGVNSLPKTVTRRRRDGDWNPGRSAPECSTLTTRLPSHTGATGSSCRAEAGASATDLNMTHGILDNGYYVYANVYRGY